MPNGTVASTSFLDSLFGFFSFGGDPRKTRDTEKVVSFTDLLAGIQTENQRDISARKANGFCAGMGSARLLDLAQDLELALRNLESQLERPQSLDNEALVIARQTINSLRKRADRMNRNCEGGGGIPFTSTPLLANAGLGGVLSAVADFIGGIFGQRQAEAGAEGRTPTAGFNVTRLIIGGVMIAGLVFGLVFLIRKLKG